MNTNTDLCGWIGGVDVDGGGFIIINGVPHPLGPSDPMTSILGQIISHSTSELRTQPTLRIASKRAALSRIMGIAGETLSKLDELETPPSQTRSDHPQRRARTVASGTRVEN